MLFPSLAISCKRSPAARWARNIGLFYALAIATGVLAGVIGALGADDFLQGTNARFISQQPDGTYLVEEQGTDIQFGRLLLYPTLVLGFGTIYVLPAILLGLGIKEVLARMGIRQHILRRLAWIGFGLPGLLAITSDSGGLFLLIGAAFLAFAGLVQLPPERAAAPHNSRAAPNEPK